MSCHGIGLSFVHIPGVTAITYRCDQKRPEMRSMKKTKRAAFGSGLTNLLLDHKGPIAPTFCMTPITAVSDFNHNAASARIAKSGQFAVYDVGQGD